MNVYNVNGNFINEFKIPSTFWPNKFAIDENKKNYFFDDSKIDVGWITSFHITKGKIYLAYGSNHAINVFEFNY